jgi:hypothetical protein
MSNEWAPRPNRVPLQVLLGRGQADIQCHFTPFFKKMASGHWIFFDYYAEVFDRLTGTSYGRFELHEIVFPAKSEPSLKVVK